MWALKQFSVFGWDERDSIQLSVYLVSTFSGPLLQDVASVRPRHSQRWQLILHTGDFVHDSHWANQGREGLNDGNWMYGVWCDLWLMTRLWLIRVLILSFLPSVSPDWPVLGLLLLNINALTLLYTPSPSTMARGPFVSVYGDVFIDFLTNGSHWGQGLQEYMLSVVAAAYMDSCMV